MINPALDQRKAPSAFFQRENRLTNSLFLLIQILTSEVCIPALVYNNLPSPLANTWLNLQEAYLSLTTKTLVFLQHVTQQYEADFIMKVDDDVYLRTDRLPHVMGQWKHHGAGPASVNYSTFSPAHH